jgi:hypothetical protein
MRPYYTHQVLEVPPIALEVQHFVLHRGWCTVCGTEHKAHVPPEHATGYGPRFSALMGELAGTYGNGRRMVQTFCASVFGVPLSPFAPGYHGFLWNIPLGCNGHTLLFARLAAIEDLKRLRRQPL